MNLYNNTEMSVNKKHWVECTKHKMNKIFVTNKLHNPKYHPTTYPHESSVVCPLVVALIYLRFSVVSCEPHRRSEARC